MEFVGPRLTVQCVLRNALAQYVQTGILKHEQNQAVRTKNVRSGTEAIGADCISRDRAKLKAELSSGACLLVIPVYLSGCTIWNSRGPEKQRGAELE